MKGTLYPESTCILLALCLHSIFAAGIMSFEVYHISHAADLTKYNCQFDEGPKLSWDYTSEMSKCDTAYPPTQVVTLIHVLP